MPSRGFCQAPNHEPNHANPYHRLTVIQAHLIIAAQAARLGEPAEGTLHDPSLWQRREPLGSIRASDDFQPQFAKGPQLLNPLDQCSQVTSVGPNNLYSHVHGDEQSDQALSGMTVLNAGGGDHERQQQSQGVDGDVAFATRHLFARIVAALPRLVGHLNGLAVDNRGCGCDLTLFGFAQPVSQRVVNEPPGPVLGPLPVIAIDCLPRTEVLGQEPPRAARADNIEDGVDQRTTLQRWSPALAFARPGLRDEGLDLTPFFIGKIGRILDRMRLHPSYL